MRITAPAARNRYHLRANAAAAEFRAAGRLGDVVFGGARGPVKMDEAVTGALTLTTPPPPPPSMPAPPTAASTTP